MKNKETTKKIKKTKTLRPIQVFLFMAACLIVLAIVSLCMPAETEIAENTIHAPQLTEVLELGEEDSAITKVIESIKPSALYQAVTSTQSPAKAIADTTSAAPVVVDSVASSSTPSDVIDTAIDTRIYLSTFRNALAQASNTPVRIMHYGDSQIEEDRLTSLIRRALQQQYGGGGVGLIPLHQTVPTSTLWQSIQINGQRQQINQGPKRYLVYGPPSMHRKNNHYGPMGQVAIMDNELLDGSEDIVLQINSGGKNNGTERYFNRIRVLTSGNISVSINCAKDRQGDVFIVPDSTSSAVIHFQGKGEVYGISLESSTGVTADNIPMRGCSGAIFTSISSNDLQQYFQATNTKLIILEYGGNIMPYTKTPDKVAQYIETMRGQIQYIKRLAPDCSILFIGPSDMSERKQGKMQTREMIPLMDQSLLQLAIEEQIGYFSLYQHMGGKDSMLKWKEQGLVGGDYVHFTHKGANKAGEMLATWLME